METVEKNILLSLLTLTSAVESKDPYTGGHCWRVSQYARLICRQLNLSIDEENQYVLAAFVHDIGKIGIPEQILDKPGSLTKDEYEVIKTHSQIGYNLIKDHPLAFSIAEIILQHHERIDGQGYPNQLTDKEILQGAKIIAICDAFDAITSDRSYQQSRSIEQARTILKQQSGSQFSKLEVQAFLSIDIDKLEQIACHSNWGRPLQECPTCGLTVLIPCQHKVGDEVFCPVCRLGDEITKLNDTQIELKPNNKVMGQTEVIFNYDPESIKDLVNSLTRPH